MSTKHVRFSESDQPPLPKGVTADQAIDLTAELACYTDQIGLHPFPGNRINTWLHSLI